MRTIASLFFFSLLLGATFAKADDATSIIESILNVDRALEEEIKSDIAEAKDKKAQLKNQISDYVRNSAQQLKDALSDKVDKLREIDEQFRQAWQKVLDKYKDIQWRLNDSSNASKERRREKLESMRATLNEMKAIITQQKEERDQKRQERRDEYENRVNQIKNDLKVSRDTCTSIAQMGRTCPRRWL
ncbi:hypothetical protein COOONC_21658 [Cooperia oncophora]